MSKSLGEAILPVIEKRLADGTLRLPTLPTTALRVMELLRKDDIDARAVVRTLEKDPLLAAQVVRAANTVAFRGRVAASNLSQAVVRLGGRQLRSFLLTATAYQLFISKDRELEEALKLLRMHSVATSLLARDLAQLTRCEEVEETYLAGLLHDIGKVVIMAFVLEVVRLQKAGRTPMRLYAEDYMPAITKYHALITAKIVAMWNLPPYVQQIISASRGYTASRRVCPANLVCFANAMTKKLRIYLGDPNPVLISTTIMIGRSVLGIDEELADRICVGLEDRVK